MHLKKILRCVDISSMTKVYEAGVRAFVIPNGRCKVLHAKCRPGPASSCNRTTPFWEASKHAEFNALDKLCRSGKSCSRSIVILFRVLPAEHPKAQVRITERWALGAADMCKSCVERLKKLPKARNVSWLTPDGAAENQLRPAVPMDPAPTAAFVRYQHHYHKRHCERASG